MASPVAMFDSEITTNPVAMFDSEIKPKPIQLDLEHLEPQQRQASDVFDVPGIPTQVLGQEGTQGGVVSSATPALCPTSAGKPFFDDIMADDNSSSGVTPDGPVSTKLLQTLKKPTDQRSRDKWSADTFNSVQRSTPRSQAGGSQEYIAVSCAGGGARSQSFCTGVLATLYETDNVTVTTVSTVSGGCWAGVGLELWRQAAIDKGLDPRADRKSVV